MGINLGKSILAKGALMSWTHFQVPCTPVLTSGTLRLRLTTNSNQESGNCSTSVARPLSTTYTPQRRQEQWDSQSPQRKVTFSAWTLPSSSSRPRTPIIRDLSQLEQGLTVRAATRKGVTNAEICTWLNKDKPDTVVVRTGNVNIVWTNARGAGASLDKAVQWDLGDEDAVSLEPRHKRQTAITIRKVTRKRRYERLHSLPSQGKAMMLPSKAKASAHFIRNGTFTRLVDGRFIHRARLDPLPVCGKPWVENKGCRRCDWEFDILSLILNLCNRAKTSMTKRHDDHVRRIKTAVGNPMTGCELLFENQTIPWTPPANRHDRPDLVIRKGTKVFVVDVTILFENGKDAFKEARKRKQEKYEYLKAVLRRGRTRSATVDAFIIGSHGTWPMTRTMKTYRSSLPPNLTGHCSRDCVFPIASSGQGTFSSNTWKESESLGLPSHLSSHNKNILRL